MWHKENFENYIVEECYKTKYSYDDKGLPSSNVPYEANKKDVILLGDSNIEARMVKNENIIHNALAKEFNYKYNFINYGLFGSSPTQQLVILQEKVDLNNTQYVIQFIDIEGDLLDVDSKNLSSLARPKVHVEFNTLDDYTIIPPRAESLYDKVSDQLSYYQIYPFIKNSIYAFKSFLSDEKTVPTKSAKNDEHLDLSKNWLYLKGALYQTNKLIKSINSNIHYKLVLRSTSEENKRHIESFLNEQNIEFIFLNETAKKMDISLDVFTCDSHWNDQGHQNIAKILRQIAFIE